MSMPPVVVLIVCKAVLSPIQSPLDQHNAKYTGWQPFQWDTTNSVMHCRRHEIQMYDPAVDQGADPQPFSQFQCMTSGIMAGIEFDRRHRNWKTWRTACPTPIVDTRTGKIIGWKPPECGGKRGTVICEQDTPI